MGNGTGSAVVVVVMAIHLAPTADSRGRPGGVRLVHPTKGWRFLKPAIPPTSQVLMTNVLVQSCECNWRKGQPPIAAKTEGGEAEKCC